MVLDTFYHRLSRHPRHGLKAPRVSHGSRLQRRHHPCVGLSPVLALGAVSLFLLSYPETATVIVGEHDRHLEGLRTSVPVSPAKFFRSSLPDVDYTALSRPHSDVECRSFPGRSQSCKFKNICYSQGDWTFYKSSFDAISPLLVREYGLNTVQITDDPSLVNLIVQPSRTTERTTERTPAERWAPRATIGNVPRSAKMHGGLYALSTRSLHSENVGHVMFDVYFPVLMDLHAFLRDPLSEEVKLLSPGPGFGERGGPENTIDDHIGSAFFSDISYLEKPRGLFSSGSHCFENIIVGSSGFSGLNGGLRGNGNTLRRARVRLLERFGVDENYGTTQSALVQNILFLRKVESAWGHNNVISNFDSMVSQVRQDFPDAVVNVVEPNNLTMAHQVRLYSSASVIVSQWGGISLLNFLAPPGATEIVVSSWFEKKKYMWSVPRSSKVLCPDWESLVRNNVADIHTFTYCTNTDGWEPMEVDPKKISTLVGKGLDLQNSGASSISRHSCLDDGSSCRLSNVCFSKKGMMYFVGEGSESFPSKFEMSYDGDVSWAKGVPEAARLPNFPVTDVPGDASHVSHWRLEPAVLALTRRSSYHSVRAALGAVMHFGLQTSGEVHLYQNDCTGLLCVDEAIQRRTTHWPAVQLSALPADVACYRDAIVIRDDFYKLTIPASFHALERSASRSGVPLFLFLHDSVSRDYMEVLLEMARSRFAPSVRFILLASTTDSSITLATVRQATVIVTPVDLAPSVIPATSSGSAIIPVALTCKSERDESLTVPRVSIERQSFSSWVDVFCLNSSKNAAHARHRFGTVAVSAFRHATGMSSREFLQIYGNVWLGASHHKTGTVLLDKLFRIINKNFCVIKTVTWSELDWSDIETCTDYLFWHGHFLSRDLAAVRQISSYRVINTARDPFWIVVSAYLYHRRGEEEWTKVRKCTGDSCPALFTNITRSGIPVHIQDAQDSSAFAQALLSYGCPSGSYSYQDCLLKVNVSRGVWIEARRSVWEIRHMHDLMLAGRDDPHIMTTCLEEFESDFLGTTRALLKFLSVPESPELLSRLVREDTYTVTKAPASNDSKHNHFTRSDPDRDHAYAAIKNKSLARESGNSDILQELSHISNEIGCSE